MPDLTPDEELFFATGELPPDLALQATPPNIEPTDPVDPTPTPAADPAPTPAATGDGVLERLLAEERQGRAALEARLEALAAKFDTATRTPDPTPPDEVNDPLGAMLHQLKTVNTQVAALETRLTTEQAANLQRQQFEQFTSAVQAAKATFEASTPDFKDAYAHIRALRADDLRAAGASEADIPKIMLNDELRLAQTAVARGKNPAEEMYGMAKRYGYTPKVAPAGTAALPADQKMQQLKAGQAAARQPLKAGADSVLTLEGLKDASNADLNKLVQDDAAWARIVGGHSNDLF